MKNIILIALTFWLGLNCAGAAIVPNGVFSNNMVLQREKPVSVWGMADPGEDITVEFAGQSKSTKAGADGKWMVQLDPMAANEKPQDLNIRSSASKLTFNNVLVGEVWLCGGQSNMEWSLSRSEGGPEAIAQANNPLLRMGRIPHNVQMTPVASVAVKWEEATPQTAKSFSAIPYWFGDQLQRELKVPVGILNNSFGGTTIQAWLPAETLAKGPWPQDKWSVLEMAKADYDQRVEKSRLEWEKYESDKAAALAANQPEPKAPPNKPSEFKSVTTLWNGEVAPLLPFAIRGVGWYQGENNAYAKIQGKYQDFLAALIRDWRSGFEQPNLPFLIFQLSRFREKKSEPSNGTGVPEVQEAQWKTAQATPNAALVVTIDQGGPDVHYTSKKPIGERAVQAVLALAYDRKILASGPVFQGLKIDGDKAVLSFTCTGAGLEFRGNASTTFAVAGEDKKFVFAQARIDGDTVVVSSPEVSKPVAVRYAWADLPDVVLFNKDGFPASPFRTDEWPLD